MSEVHDESLMIDSDDIVEEVLESSDPSGVRIEGMSPLMYLLALYEDEAGAALVRGLGAACVASHGEYDSSGYTALHAAAAFGLPLTAAALLDVGVLAEVESEDAALAQLGFFQSGGRTPLHCAAMEGHAELVALLLARGASANAVDFEGNTPLLLARMRRQEACIAALSGGATTSLWWTDAARLAVEPRGAVVAVAEAEAAPGEAWLKAKQAADRARVKARVARSAEPVGRLRELHVLPALLSASECAHLLSVVLATAARDGWQRTRHAAYPTTDMRASDAGAEAWPLARTLLEERAFPAMAKAFGFGVAQLRFRDLFFVKYSAAEEGVQSGLAPHRDGSLLSLNILLNDPAEFEGGGTLFLDEGVTLNHRSGGGSGDGSSSATIAAASAAAPAPPAATAMDVVAIQRGDCLVHCGRLLHSGVPISRGHRYLLVGFIDVRMVYR